MKRDTVRDKHHHAGFDIVANRVIEIFREYMDRDNDMNGDICFWVTGHSMGGGVANLVASELLHGRSGINNRTDNVYCYTFAAPNTFYLTDNVNVTDSVVYPGKKITETYREPHGIKYRCIFNVVNGDDFVPELPMKDCGWTKYGRTATLSFNSNKKRIEDIVKSESKYDTMNYNWTNTKRFINETYLGNTQTIRDIIGSFNGIFEDDPENMRNSAYTFNDNDYVYMHFSDLTVPNNVKPYQKIDTVGEENIEYQMPAYFMQYLSFAMKSKLNSAGFWLAQFNRRCLGTKSIIVDRNAYIQTPHYLESYYYLTKKMSVNDFK